MAELPTKRSWLSRISRLLSFPSCIKRDKIITDLVSQISDVKCQKKTKGGIIRKFYGQGNSKFLLKVGEKSGNFIIRLTHAFILVYVVNATSHFTPNSHLFIFVCSNYHGQG